MRVCKANKVHPGDGVTKGTLSLFKTKSRLKGVYIYQCKNHSIE